MENTGWKSELKKHLKGSFKEFLDMMLTMFCMTATAGFAIFSQTENQLRRIQEFLNEGDYVVIAILLIGLIVFARIVEFFVVGLYSFIRFIVLLIFRK